MRWDAPRAAEIVATAGAVAKMLPSERMTRQPGSGGWKARGPVSHLKRLLAVRPRERR